MSRMRFHAFAPAFLSLLLVSAAAEAVFTVNMPWVRPTPDRRETEAYMVVTSSEDAVLREARSVIAATVVIRAASAGGRRLLPALPLPAGAAVKFAPGEVRLGLVGLARPLKVSERVPIVLVVEARDGTRQEIPVNAEVRLRSPVEDERRAHQH
jgi:periplasmic copper chaperone A